MRRSLYTGSSNRQRKKSRPSSCIKGEKVGKKSRKVPKVKINNEKYLKENKGTENIIKTEKLKNNYRQNADNRAQDDLDFNLDTLSYNFSLFLCYKDLKVFIQKRTTIKFFKRWQHRFTSSVLRQIKNAQSKKVLSSNEQFSYDTNQPISYTYNNPPVQAINQLFISDGPENDPFTDQIIMQHMYNDHKNSCNKNMGNTNNIESSPDMLLPGTSNPNEIAHSVISPNSPILIASTSLKDMDDNSSALSIDQVLDFTNYENNNLPVPDKTDPVDNFLQTITQFVSSDEFNSDSLGQMSAQINSLKSSQINNNNSPQSPSPPSNKVKPKLQHCDGNQDDPLGSTLPTDLFTSSNSDDSMNELPSQSYYKDEYTQSPKRIKKKRQSPIKMDEELLIKAALVDEFEHDKRKEKAKQSDSDKITQNCPRSAKRRKIIIVREYSDDDLDHKHDNLNLNLSDNDDNDTDIIYQNQKKLDNYPIKKNKKRNFESPPKKFTFSDESFSEGEIQENQYNNQNYNYPNSNQVSNDNYSYNPDSNMNNDKSYQDQSINYNDNNHSTNNSQNAPNKKKVSKPKNNNLNNQNEEESSLHFSSTIEFPQVELKDIVKSSSKNNPDLLTDDDSSSSEKNVSVMTMTDDRKKQNSDSEPFYGFGRKNYDIPGVNSSDEIEYLMKDDNDKISIVPKKTLPTATDKNDSNKHQDDFNSNNFSYNDISYDDDF